MRTQQPWQIPTMAFIDDHKVILIDRRGLGCVSCKQNAPDKPLSGANVDFGLSLRRYFPSPFKAKDFSEVQTPPWS